MKRPSKKQLQSYHAMKRAMQRFGKRYNRFIRREMVDMIHRGEATLIKKQSNRVSKWRLTYDGQVVDVIYDRNRQNIVTFLIPDKEEKNE